MNYVSQLARLAYNFGVKPRSVTPDDRRREYILNVLLGGLLLICLLALISSLLTLILKQNHNGITSLILQTGFLAALVVIRWLVWRRHLHLASWLLLSIFLIVVNYLIVVWSFILTPALMADCMIIIIAGIIGGAWAGIICTGLAITLLAAAASVQISGVLPPDLSWRREPPLPVDAISYCLIFSIIGLVSWLYNREIDGSLRRARQSEALLTRERDNLEETVAARTRQPERIRLVRALELERLAGYGRTHAGLVHDLSSPLMAASIDLQQLPHHPVVDQAKQSLERVERLLKSARDDLNGSSELSRFDVRRELRQAVDTVRPGANQQDVKITVVAPRKPYLFGSAVKYSQIIINVLNNAIESYAGVTERSKEVVVMLDVLEAKVVVKVTDKGQGISRRDIPHIFTAFYSGKQLTESQGTGIGLSVVKQIVEDDFQGSVSVHSQRHQGTTLTLNFPVVHD